MSVIISPSLLSADFGNLNSEIDMINASAADWLHIIPVRMANDTIQIKYYSLIVFPTHADCLP